MEISSRDFTKWTVQEAVDFLIDRGSNGAICKGVVDGVFIQMEQKDIGELVLN